MKALKMTSRKLKSKDRKPGVCRGFRDAEDYMADLKRSGYEEASIDEPGPSLVQMVVDRGWVERGLEGGEAFADEVLALWSWESACLSWSYRLLIHDVHLCTVKGSRHVAGRHKCHYCEPSGG